MTGSGWKLRVDRRGVTITTDRFQLTTGRAQTADTPLDADALAGLDDTILAATDSSQMEAVVSELSSLTRRRYGQYCGLARAMEVLGERWAFLVVRDLLVGPRRFADLHRGLPRIPTDVLHARLRELEHNGIIRRRTATRPDRAEVYELTEYGRELDQVTLTLGLWGAKMLRQPHPEDVVTPDALVRALQATFVPAAAHEVRVSYEVRVGEVVVHARVDNGVLHAAAGSLGSADLIIEPGGVLRGLLGGEVSPAQALGEGSVRIIGDPVLLDLFTTLFRIPR